MATGFTHTEVKYIYNLPYHERSELCKVLNLNDSWKELAGTWMKINELNVRTLSREKNPTDELLTLWGQQNHTVLELFILLSRMDNYQAMVQIKSFVDPKYHALIDNGEKNLQRIIHSILNEPVPPLQMSPPLQAISFGHLNGLSPAGIPYASPKQRDEAMSSRKKTMITLPKTEANLPEAPYQELEAATSGWSVHNILGKGGFGTVYRGQWKNTYVAIKRLEARPSGPDDQYIIHLQQSFREIKILNSRAHENILPLYSYSLNGEAPCLVYMFMPNGSLDDVLRLKRGHRPLTWIQRHVIALGTARGIQYLHTIGEKPWIHGDIKSANILLDKNMEPKLGDFGLAREGHEHEDVLVSRIQGTRPYLPDEYLREKMLSTKIDTYSYGIVLFELSTGLAAYDGSRPQYKFLKQFVDSWSECDIPLMMDKTAGKEKEEVFKNLLFIGKWCTNSHSKDRPEMEYVFRKLNNL
ncbi:serine/threonine-protein kinase pelle isoform X2 [Cephus cinctus]|uniref:non-specific serine/threonine protein kinase n=2 Tax=Cephus cinctus TaxID=211228 RepID=A0AAJ7BRT0_CEPCN|nr:serine/threonine-protein kinase pelle isoform X2 [Cephus cinctus]